MRVEIRSTTVEPTEAGNIVRLHISDAPPDAPFASIDLQITASLPRYEQIVALKQVQHRAMKIAQGVLTAQLQELLNELVRAGFDQLGKNEP